MGIGQYIRDRRQILGDERTFEITRGNYQRLRRAGTEEFVNAVDRVRAAMGRTPPAKNGKDTWK